MTFSYLIGNCTIECHLRNVSHLKKILRSLPNGETEWVNRWSQNCLGSVRRAACAQDHMTARERGTRWEGCLEEDMFDLCLREKESIRRGMDGMTRRQTERPTPKSPPWSCVLVRGES